MSCTKLQLPPESPTRGLPPSDPRSLCPLPSTEFVDPSPTNKIPGYATDIIQVCWQLASRIRMERFWFCCKSNIGKQRREILLILQVENGIPQYTWCILDPGQTIIGIATSFSLIVTIVVIKEPRRNLGVQGRGANAPPILFHRKNIYFFATLFERGANKKRKYGTWRSFGPCKDRKMIETKFLSLSYLYSFVNESWSILHSLPSPSCVSSDICQVKPI